MKSPHIPDISIVLMQRELAFLQERCSRLAFRSTFVDQPFGDSRFSHATEFRFANLTQAHISGPVEKNAPFMELGDYVALKC